MNTHSALRALASRLKGRQVELDERVGTGTILSLALDKLFCLIRGVVFSRRVLFVGKGTRISGTALLRVGRGVEIGRYSEIDCLGRKGLHIGSGSSIGAYSVVRISGSLSDIGEGICIGENVGIGDFAHIGGAGGVLIGDDTIVGAYMSIHPENHSFDSVELPIRLQGVTRRGIRIGRNCWIGAKATFLDGSAIGNGCIVGAGAVVRGSFGDNQILAGVPARVIGER